MAVQAVARYVLLVVTLIGVAGCSVLPTHRQLVEESTPTPIPTPIVPVKPTYVVQRGDVARQMVFRGRIAPVEEKELFFRSAGHVRNVFVKRDELVAAGQLMADLEIEDLERELTSAELELERANVRLERAEREQEFRVRRAQVNLEIARLNVKAARAKDPAPRKAQADAALEEARIALQRAQDNYDAIAWRNDRGTTRQAAALQQATLDYQQAQAAYDLALQAIGAYEYDVAIKDRLVQLAETALEELQDGLDPLLQNDVQRASLQVEKLKATIADAQIVAPFDGKILSLSLEPGLPVEAFKPVAIVADPGSLEISADLGSSQLFELTEGMPVTVRLTSRPGDETPGYVRRLPYPYGGGGRSASAIDEDKSTRVALDTPVAEAGFEQGDMVWMTVVLERSEHALWLPRQAVRLFEGRRFVVVQEGEAQRRVDVKVGIISEDRVEILSGLEEGQVVIGQ